MEKLLHGSCIARGGRRHEIMQVDDHERVIVAVQSGPFGELAPPGTDVDLRLLEAPEQRHGICDVQILIRMLGAYLAIIDVDDAVVLLEVETEERFVPAQVEREVIATMPVLGAVRDPRDALSPTTLHFGDVRNGVRRPDVARVELHGTASEFLGARVIPRLLQTVGVTAKYVSVSGQRGVPEFQHTTNNVSHPLALAEIREHELRHLDGQQIEWMVAEDCAPMRDGTAHVAPRPGVQRLDVARLARRARLAERRLARTRERGARLIRTLTLARQHAQISVDAMREREVRV